VGPIRITDPRLVSINRSDVKGKVQDDLIQTTEEDQQSEELKRGHKTAPLVVEECVDESQTEEEEGEQVPYAKTIAHMKALLMKKEGPMQKLLCLKENRDILA